MLKHVVRAAAVVGVIILAIVVIGYALPVAHLATRDASLDRPPAAVFAVLQDIDRYPSWRSDVQSVEVLARTPALRWREHGDNGTITFEIVEARPPARLVSRIADPSLPFGGTWTYELTPHASGTRLTITEAGEVYNPVFRFMSRFVFGHTATMDRFLTDLTARLRQG